MIRKPHFLTIFLALAAAPAWAQSDDPPSRVARLSYQSGSVAFRPAAVEEWSNATLNYPLTTGDHLWTDAGAGAIGRDAFERGGERRARREDQSVSAQYVPREMTGYQDLDDYGSWREESQYGWVWRPRTVAMDWAPYRYGHWAWVEPWG